MADTYTLLERISVGAAGASSVTFTSIPQTYTDLKVIASARADALQTTLVVEFNGSTTGYTSRYVYGDGSTATSGNASAAYFGGVNPSTYTASTFGSTEIYIPNYTSSNYKSLSSDSVIENNATAATAALWAGLWSNTAAITSIKLSLLSSANFVQYSTFYLYGIAKDGVNPSLPSAPYATGGDSIVFDGTYWIHTFTSSGTFTPKKALSCDYLVVAGGGGGGWRLGGGAGAGGLRSTVTATGGGGSLESALSLTANTGYTVTIGAGGAGSTSFVAGNPGSNSSISGTNITTVTSTGGGQGGNANGTTFYSGGNGGSGGGGSGGAGGFGGSNNGSGTANQGYAGGKQNDANRYAAGGGGGAGAAGNNGSDGTTTTGGKGGNGVAVAISGASVTYAGGGGGQGDPVGNGGTGGGGAGGNPNTGSSGTDGTVNTGGGGGGSSNVSTTSGAGGSGIVIVRYAA